MNPFSFNNEPVSVCLKFMYAISEKTHVCVKQAVHV